MRQQLLVCVQIRIILVRGKKLKQWFGAQSIHLLILLKNPLRFFSFLGFGTLTDEPEFVAVIDFPFHHLTGLDINGGCQRQRQVHITLRDSFFATDGLDLSRIVHDFVF